MASTTGHGDVHTASATLHRLGAQTRERLAGPGGLYNAGNAIGLAMGIALQISAAPEADAGGALAATFDYLAGNTGAIALTAATAVFFVSGEAYHRAWANGSPPNATLNRRGDLLSAIGALILGVALLSLGHIWLAATAGLLHALGKFGSARKWRAIPGWRSDWPDFYRSAVLASRVPAILVALMDLSLVIARSGSALALADILTPVTLLVCYAFWSWADLLLFQPAVGPAGSG